MAWHRRPAPGNWATLRAQTLTACHQEKTKTEQAAGRAGSRGRAGRADTQAGRHTGIGTGQDRHKAGHLRQGRADSRQDRQGHRAGQDVVTCQSVSRDVGRQEMSDDVGSEATNAKRLHRPTQGSTHPCRTRSRVSPVRARGWSPQRRP